MYGKRENMIPSRFLKEAQPILFPKRAEEEIKRRENAYRDYNERRYADTDEAGTPSTGSGYSSTYAKSFLQSNKPKANTSVQYDKFKTGVKVRHVKFGEGMVIITKGSGDNLIVDVAFKGVGIKSLSAKFAPMEIL